MDRFAGTTAGESLGRAVQAARDAFGPAWNPDGFTIAPGRIELLGNHVDYNGGPVLAAAIDRFIVVAIARDPGRAQTVRAIAADAPDEAVATLDAHALADWRNASPPPRSLDYVRGVLAGLQTQERSSLRTRLPASIAIAGDVPIGFGVSSSAALCVSLALALGDGFSGPEEVVLLAQEAEHRAGTPCGTMDQSASISGGVIAFDGATLGVERLSPRLGDLVFAVADSGVERSLSTSSYPRRVEESRQALELARTQLGTGIPYLAAITPEQLDALDRDDVLPEPLLRRVRHVVEETARVAEGRAAMAAGDWPRFGRLMTASGHSSATLYEISHPRVEELVAEALTVAGTLGARMMGGGEGGAALALISRDAVPGLEETLRSGYYARHGMADRDGLIHTCAFAPGATYMTAADGLVD
ncbi:MAG TPA: galactokinase family protein [Thermomicrobiales bacterium]|nr:galactokinase family protein [Thermomicrobiales bacterium]